MTEQERKERPNKSALKREWQERQAIVEQMAGLARTELVRLGVNDRLRDALHELAEMRSSGARNRQLKYCANLIELEELGSIRAFLADRQSQRVASNQQFPRIERWRDRLIVEGDNALEALLEDFPHLDRQHLRRLCRDAMRERKDGRPVGAGRKLFRYLKEILLGDADAPQDSGSVQDRR